MWYEGKVRRRVGSIGRRGDRSDGFSLIELLTVVFIISLLIAILIPALSSARQQAHKVATSELLRVIEAGLELFRNDNEAQFRQTNGYPPSFSHPKMGNDVAFDPKDGDFPFLIERPRVYGAHWLPAMLVGMDQLGYVQRSSVPQTLRAQPEEWYKELPLGQDGPLPRTSLYINPDEINLIRTDELPGVPPGGGMDSINTVMFPEWDAMRHMPVIGDAWDQPILYYAANKYGKLTNMVGYNRTNVEAGKGQPFYYHMDNWGFTGATDGAGLGGAGSGVGWRFGDETHKILRAGSQLTAIDFEADVLEDRETFARYILDVHAFEAIQDPTPNSPLKSVNRDNYLLISAGPDGIYGNADDVSNIRRFGN